MSDTTNPNRWPRWLERASTRWHLIAVGFALVLYAGQLWAQKWISDDGYIYLTYVKNLFEQGELVYNLGERVNAATGFLWLLGLIAGKAVFFFLDLRQVTFILSWVCALLAFWVLARQVRAGEHRFLVAIAIIFFTPFVISFSTSGLETPLILLLSVLVYDLGRRHFRSPAMALMLGAAPFIRPELGILLLVYWACLLRRLDPRNLAISAGALLFLSTARWLCFGDVLPNTAFIKLLSPTYGQGGRYFFEFFASYWYFGVMCGGFVAVGGRLLCRLACRKQLPESIGEQHLFTIVSTYLSFAYVYASGGDFMHGRFFLTPFVFVTLLVVDAAPHLVSIPRVRWRPAAIPLVTVAAAIAASLAIPYNLRDDRHSYARIMDEQAYWAATNPRLTAWSEPNLDPRAERGRRYHRLAGRVGRRVGVAAGAIGQIGYYRDSDRVYVYDVVSLTNVVGSMLHTQGYYRRMGHNVPLPAPLGYLEPRLTLFRPPDYKLSKNVQFEFEGEEFWVGALRDVDAYVTAGLLPTDTWTRVDDRIRAILKSTWIDRNVVFYLRHRYPEDRPLFSASSTRTTNTRPMELAAGSPGMSVRNRSSTWLAPSRTVSAPPSPPAIAYSSRPAA